MPEIEVGTDLNVSKSTCFFVLLLVCTPRLESWGSCQLEPVLAHFLLYPMEAD